MLMSRKHSNMSVSAQPKTNAADEHVLAELWQQTHQTAAGKTLVTCACSA